MDPTLRKALHNLQGVFDEGFLSKAEYDQRRKALIDGATTCASMDDDTTAAGGAKKSVFDRLGGGKVEAGKWGHDGFEKMYGKAGPGKAAGKGGISKTIGKTSIRDGKKAAPGGAGANLFAKATLSARFSADSQPVDLRSKLSGKGPGAKKAASSKRAALPAKCPW